MANTKLFVMVPASATTFDGQTKSAASPKKIFFEAAKNTIWVNGVGYGVDPTTAAQITTNKNNIAELVKLIGASTLAEGDPTLIARIVALESGKVSTGTTIAGIDLADNITSAELTGALDVATTTAKGLMSSDDKTKLDGIEAGAQVNKIETINYNGSDLAISDKKVSFEAVTDVKIGTGSVVTDHVATIATKSAYDAESNKIITENDIKALEGAMHFVGVITRQEGETDQEAIARVITGATSGDVVVMSDNAKEYIYVDPDPETAGDEAWREIGDEAAFVLKTTTIAGVDLADSITSEELRTALNVADGAQVNVLEGVQVNGTDLAITDKKVNVTIAKGDTAGTIKVNGSEVAVGDIDGNDIALSADYKTADTYVAPATGDTLDAAIGKLARGIEAAATGGVLSVGGATGAVTLAQSATEVQLAATTGDAGVLSATLVDGGVATAKLADSAVTTAKIADANVTVDKLASDSVTTVKIVDANVTTAKIADDAVTTAKILDANVTADKLASDSVTTDKIVDANVTTAKIADDAVTLDKIADDAMQQATDVTKYTNTKVATAAYVEEQVASGITGLDAEVETEASATKLTDTSVYVKVTEADGKLTAVSVDVDPWEDYTED